jgi:hypothetical protein
MLGGRWNLLVVKAAISVTQLERSVHYQVLDGFVRDRSAPRTHGSRVASRVALIMVNSDWLKAGQGRTVL